MATDKNQAVVDGQVFAQFGDLTSRLANDRVFREDWLSASNGRTTTAVLFAHVAAIVLLDQFPRHLHRLYGVAPEDAHKRCPLPPVESTDELALEICERLMQAGEDEDLRLTLYDNVLTIPMQVFALMPLRHSRTLPSLQRVMAAIDFMDKRAEEGDKALLSRFRRASARRLQTAQDLVRHNEVERIQQAQKGGSGFDDDEILEHFEFDGDEKDVVKNKLYVAMEAFLLKTHPYLKKKSETEATPVVVSLSGGVDSMVIAKILVLLRAKYNLRVIAVHIDYANRPEAGAESQFVERWCKKHEIVLQVRTINEVTRGITSRDEYEKISREIRYDAYKEVIAKLGGSGVMFGHHQGDVQENVISNSMKGKGPLDLSGMGEIGVVNKVSIFRPFIDNVKEDIFEFAHVYGVPYFKDTTPSWSTRGLMRNKLVPLLSEMFGEGFLSNLTNLAKASDSAQELVRSSITQPFVEATVKSEAGSYFDTKPFAKQPVFFWKTAFQNLLHSMGMPMLSGKAMGIYAQHVSEDASGTDKWLQCRPDFGTFMRADGFFFVFNRKHFVWAGKRQKETKAQVESMRVGESKVIRGWKIEASEVVGAIDLERPFKNLEQLLTAKFEYCVYVKGPGRELATIELLGTARGSETKPHAWRGIHEKILNSLPIMDNRVGGRVALDDAEIESCVRVRLKYEYVGDC
jgi:tRNA(Ile)-lysidine synthetase-like protein